MPAGMRGVFRASQARSWVVAAVSCCCVLCIICGVIPDWATTLAPQLLPTLPVVTACSFFATTQKLLTSGASGASSANSPPTLDHVNFYMQRRGPDATNAIKAHGFTFVHNLLHMTGERRLQPFSYQNNKIQVLFNGEIYNYKDLGREDLGLENGAKNFWSGPGGRSVGADFGGRGENGAGAGNLSRLSSGGGVGVNSGGSSAGSPSTKRAGGAGAASSATDPNYRYNYDTDGECIKPLYDRMGARFSTLLDGEYAIAIFDFRHNILTLSTDVFGTKPLWYSFGDNHDGVHIATYESGLERLGCCNDPKKRFQVPPNTVLVINLVTRFIISQFAVFEFDTNQHKTGVQDWVDTFHNAVEKRVRYQRHGVFLGLSSGYDSGAVQLALHNLRKPHFAYTIYAEEKLDVVGARLNFESEGLSPPEFGSKLGADMIGSSGNTAIRNQDVVEGNVVAMSVESLTKEREFLQKMTEPFYYKATDGQKVYVSTDFASSGLSWIAREARRRGILIYLSGSGADEYISDYGDGSKRSDVQSIAPGQSSLAVTLEGTSGDETPAVAGQQVGDLAAFLESTVAGQKIYPHSNFGGHFPESLNFAARGGNFFRAVPGYQHQSQQGTEHKPDPGTFFPWESLFLGTQRDYLMKEELVAGTHGVEGRYPFLDKFVVQEYLWLNQRIEQNRMPSVTADRASAASAAFPAA